MTLHPIPEDDHLLFSEMEGVRLPHVHPGSLPRSLRLGPRGLRVRLFRQIRRRRPPSLLAPPSFLGSDLPRAWKWV